MSFYRFGRAAFLSATVSLAALGLAAGSAVAAPDAPVREVLPATARPVHYSLTIAPDAAALTFAGEAKIDVVLNAASQTLTLNSADLTIRSAEAVQNGQKIKLAVQLDAEHERLILTAPKPLKTGSIQLLIRYTGVIKESSAGLFATDYVNASGQKTRMLTTQFEPGDARHLAPMWDEPAYKAVWELALIGPKSLTAVGNMPAVKTEILPDGRQKTRFAATPPMSSYLLFLGLGEFDRISGPADGVDVGVISQAGRGERGRYALETSRKLLPYYNAYFGQKFPLPKLDNLGVPGAGGFGAMENWGAIMYFEDVLLIDPKVEQPSSRKTVFTVVAHEMAHQWFGDLVTMKWWDNLWLNEGFASWMEAHANAHFNPQWNEQLESLGAVNSAMSIDARASTHPIIQPVKSVQDSVAAFDTISYQKGQSIIRMIEAYLGEDTFRDGIRLYMKTNAYHNATTEDLWRALETASHKPIADIAHDFTLRPGVPMLRVNGIRCSADGRESVVDLSQDRFGVDAPSKTAQTWRTPVVASLVGSPTETRAVITGAPPQTLTVAGCGPVKLNAGQTGYYRTLYADAPFQSLAGAFSALPAVDQQGLLLDAYALGAAGYAPLARYLELSDKLAPQSDPLILSGFAGRLSSFEGLYRDLPGEAAYAAWARGRLSPLLAQVGWTKAPGEADNVTELRLALISALANLHDPAVIAEAKRRFEASAQDPSALPPELKRTVISVVGAYADAATFGALTAAFQKADTIQTQKLYLYALARVRDPKLAARFLDFAISDATPKQLAPAAVATVADRHFDLAFDYSVAHMDRLSAGIDTMERKRYLSGLLRGAQTQAELDHFDAFVAAHPDQVSEKSVKTARDSVLYSLQVRGRLGDVDQWLKAHASK